MGIRKVPVPFLVYGLMLFGLFLGACAYIVLPEETDSLSMGIDRGWHAVATAVSQTDTGDLRIDITIRNDTANWSAMKAADKAAVLTLTDGKTTSCETVYIGTGGHRLAPGFQMRGYTGGKKANLETQLLYVICKGAEAAPGSKLAVNYSYVTGEYNYYYPEENKVDAKLEIDLDQLAADLKYPIAESIDGLIRTPEAEITALNDVKISLSGVERTATGVQFQWLTFNPGEYPTYVHVGTPPVIGSDGILYRYYESPDLVSVPITPAGDKADWTTEVAVPQETSGLYVLAPIESKKQKLFVSYAIDITGY
jgi:hypothetical protein